MYDELFLLNTKRKARVQREVTKPAAHGHIFFSALQFFFETLNQPLEKERSEPVLVKIWASNSLKARRGRV